MEAVRRSRSEEPTQNSDSLYRAGRCSGRAAIHSKGGGLPNESVSLDPEQPAYLLQLPTSPNWLREICDGLPLPDLFPVSLSTSSVLLNHLAQDIRYLKMLWQEWDRSLKVKRDLN